MSKVMIHPATYENMHQAVERAFELFPLDLRGKTVLIKPNVLRASLANEGVVTHPAVLRAVVEKVETMGPSAMVVGDNPGVLSYGANEESFQKTGLMEAAGSPERFHEMLVDVFRLRVPDFFLMDAVVGMEGNGPASPDLRDIGLILASDNAVAMDAVVAKMMGCEPHLLRFLQKANEMGLGDYDLDAIEIIGNLEPIPDFKLPPLSGEAILHNAPMQALLQSRTLLRPRIDFLLCTGCATCIDQCPVSALSMGEQFSEVTAETCITCFCCQETCPEKAISLQ